jgi:glucose/arabinose dehydrogenase
VIRNGLFGAALAIAGAGLALVLATCTENADLPVGAGVGPEPALPAPDPELVPTLDIAPAEGWPAGEAPVAAPGLAVAAFATGLDHPRWLYVLPNGDVLVAETNRQPDARGGVTAFVERQVLGLAGAATPSADRITLLRDADGDGVPDLRTVLFDRADGLVSPFGMAWLDGHLYVASTGALMRFPYVPGATGTEAPGEVVAALPDDPPNRHWTKGLAAGPDGMLYVSAGSNSDHAENGLAAEEGRAAIWQVDPTTGAARVFASGLRNPVGMGFEPETGVLWAVVNERDGLGGDVPPDYLTAVRPGGFYGWPWSYWGANPDPRLDDIPQERVAQAIVPDYALGVHVAPLGLVFAHGAQLGARLGERFAEGAFVGLHGSWNRNPPAGYRVIFVPFEGGRPAGEPVEVLAGFLGEGGDAWGRPVGVAIDRTGALLVADDVGNTIWRVTPEGGTGLSPAMLKHRATRFPLARE